MNHRETIVLRVIKTGVVRGHVRVDAKHCSHIVFNEPIELAMSVYTGKSATEWTVRQIVIPVRMYHDVRSINPALCANGVDDVALDKFLARYGEASQQK